MTALVLTTENKEI